MNKKEAFLKFIRNCRITPEEYQLAKTYYLQEADEREIDTYNNFLKILVPALQKSYIKSSLHFKALAKKHGLSEQDALEFIQSFQIYDSNIFLNDLQNKGINIEEYLRGLYVACQNFNYYKSKLVDLARKIDITYKLFLELVQIYMKKYLNSSKEEIETFIKRIDVKEDFYTFIEEKSGNFDNACYYANNFAKKEEALAFQNVTMEIVEEFYQENLDINTIAEKISAKYHLSFNKAVKLVKQYKSWQNNKSREVRLLKYKILCDMFLNDCSYEDIAKYIEDSDISWDYLRRTYLDIYIKSIDDETERKASYDILLSRMQKYLRLKKNERRVLKYRLYKEPFDEEFFREAKRIITKFVYEDIEVRSFKRKLGNEIFIRYLTLVEKYDKPLYDLYLIRRYNKNYNLDDNIIKTLMDYINNGINDNGMIREFNILDYFKIFRLPIYYLIGLLQDYDNDVKRIIVSFLSRNKSRLQPLDNILSQDVTEEEDNAVRNYLIENDLPMFDMVYTLALEEYRNGKLYNTQNSRK